MIFFLLSKQHRGLGVRVNVVSEGGRLANVLLKYVRAVIAGRCQMSWGEGEGRVVNPNKVCLLEFKDDELRVVCGGQNR